MNDSTRYQLLRLLEDSPEISQREMARHLGLSLGKTNYCLRALIEKGWVKAQNFTNSRKKSTYMYILTPKGIVAKTRITRRFLQGKLNRCEELRAEIEELRAKVAEQKWKR